MKKLNISTCLTITQDMHSVHVNLWKLQWGHAGDPSQEPTGGTGCHAKREGVSDKMLLAEILSLKVEPIKSFWDLASKPCVDLLV